eukprot:2013966-Amphidinium_carterae.1
MVLATLSRKAEHVLRLLSHCRQLELALLQLKGLHVELSSKTHRFVFLYSHAQLQPLRYGPLVSLRLLLLLVAQN